MSANRTDAIQIARRYATAIFAQALETKKQDEVVSEISTIAQAITDNASLREALANPLVTRAEKAAVLTGLSAKADPLTLRALDVVGNGGRAEILPQVAELLRAELSKLKGELIAHVTSARPLAAAVQKQLEAALIKATGKTVQIQLHQDPVVLGGLAIQLGSLRLDATLAGALNTMRAQMSAPASTL